MADTTNARQSFHFQVITTPTSDTPGTTVFLHFDDKRYVFGRIAEGTQRAFIQRGIGIKKIRNLFLTGRTCWEHNGGLLGMILTMADVQAGEIESETNPVRPRLNIHGPPRILHMMASARKFVFRTGMPLTVHEQRAEDSKAVEQPTWSDNNIRVWALPAVPAYVADATEAGSHYCDDSSQEYLSDSEGMPISRARPARKTLEAVESEQDVRSSIVQNMFDSEWQRDRLVERPFKDVDLPATVFIRDPDTKALNSFLCNSASSFPQISEETKVLVRLPWPASVFSELPSPSNSGLTKASMSYIVRGHTQRGVFDAKKAIRLGIKPGRLFGRLADGQNVELEDGTLITPDMVLGQAKPGRGVAIIDIPHQSLIDSVLARPEWKSVFVMEGVEAIFWILSGRVLCDARIDNFMKSFPRVKHIVSSDEVSPNTLSFESAAASAIRLSCISREYFPVPIFDNMTVPQTIETMPTSIIPKPNRVVPDFGDYIVAERGMKLQIEPEVRILTDEIPPLLDDVQLIRSVPPEVTSLAQQARDEIKSVTAYSDSSQIPNQDAEIITLGTGSAVPSKYRNVSATLVRVPGCGNYLFDCGENTLGQLKRLFSADELHDLMLNLKMIWISHLHADHHLGLIPLLRQFHIAVTSSAESKSGKYTSKDKTPSLCIASEGALFGFLRDVAGVERLGAYTPLFCSPEDIRDQACMTLGHSFPEMHVKDLQICRVKHCKGAQAISVTFDNGFKFSYSGDCRPSRNFAKIGADSDVLVHEATFDDGLEGDAKAKKHSTTAEALAVATEMRAKNVILTHFSQRYQKIPVMANVKFPETIDFEEGDELDSAAGPVDDTTSTDGPPNHSLEKSLDTERSSSEDQASQYLSKQRVPQNVNICVAFDFMRVCVADIEHLHKFRPALETLFDLDDKRDKAVPPQWATPKQKDTFERQLNQKANKKRRGSETEKYANGLQQSQQQSEQKDGSTLSKKQLRKAAKTQYQLEEKVVKGTESLGDVQLSGNIEHDQNSRASNGESVGKQTGEGVIPLPIPGSKLQHANGNAKESASSA